MELNTCDYCGDGVATKRDEIDRCDLCWEHHYNLLNPDYAAKNGLWRKVITWLTARH